jgi:single-stranded-DNA-specific exonuclease
VNAEILIRLRQPADGVDKLPDDLHPVLRRILLSRNVLCADDLDLALGRMAPPHSLSGIDVAARLLADALCEDRRILVVGDFDADGATGTALALRGLRALGARNVAFRVPNRFEFGYGLTPGLVETLRDEPPDVLVTVDSGIGCLPGVA